MHIICNITIAYNKYIYNIVRGFQAPLRTQHDLATVHWALYGQTLSASSCSFFAPTWLHSRLGHMKLLIQRAQHVSVFRQKTMAWYLVSRLLFAFHLLLQKMMLLDLLVQCWKPYIFKGGWNQCPAQCRWTARWASERIGSKVALQDMARPCFTAQNDWNFHGKHIPSISAPLAKFLIMPWHWFPDPFLDSMILYINILYTHTKQLNHISCM